MNSFLASALRFLYHVSLALLVLTLPWQTGWVVVGDAYSLGPYLPWLELVFPLAGLGVWGVFFMAWAQGDLRKIHNTRWFYLLLFVSLLMLNILVSVNPEGSLGWLSLWLTGSLLLSVRWRHLFHNAYFWGWYAAGLGLNLVLWQLYPGLISVVLLAFMGWFAALHWWQQADDWRWRLALTVGSTALAYALAVPAGLLLLITLGWLYLWGREYRAYHDKHILAWSFSIGSLLVFTTLWVLPLLDLSGPQNLNLGSTASWLHGVGWGQLEWAQHLAQTEFKSPDSIITDLWAGIRWWHEMGLLLLLWLPCLYLLTLGHEQKQIGFRTTLFFAVAVLAPSLWLSPGGILLGSFWFFNRQAWVRSTPLFAADTLNFAAKSVDHSVRSER